MHIMPDCIMLYQRSYCICTGMLHNPSHAVLQVRWGGRSQDGAGNTVGEEVEQVLYTINVNVLWIQGLI